MVCKNMIPDLILSKYIRSYCRRVSVNDVSETGGSTFATGAKLTKIIDFRGISTYFVFRSRSFEL